jgi:hypothetical protein
MRKILIIALMILVSQISYAGTFKAKTIKKDYAKIVPVKKRARTIIDAELKKQKALAAAQKKAVKKGK